MDVNSSEFRITDRSASQESFSGPDETRNSAWRARKPCCHRRWSANRV